MAVSKQPSLTPDTSSGEGLDDDQPSRGEAKWKRFHPFKVVRKIFRRRVKRQGSEEVQETSKKSWSTSELQCVQDNRYDKPPYKVGLSVSHDSIFSPDHSTSVNHDSMGEAQGSSLSVQNAGIKVFKEELFTRVRARRDSNDDDEDNDADEDEDDDDDDDDDMGLPHSPCTSPTTVDVLAQGLKDKSKTTCSAGSLISMGSSENDEDSTGQLSSGHSSKMSLLDRRSLDSEDLDVHQSVPLSHKAAHHRIAVRPKRTHGLPRHRCLKQLAASGVSTLPSTPEVSEDGMKPMSQSIRTTLATESSTEVKMTISSSEHLEQESSILPADGPSSSSITPSSGIDYFKKSETSSISCSKKVLEDSEIGSSERNDVNTEIKMESTDMSQTQQIVEVLEQQIQHHLVAEGRSFIKESEEQQTYVTSRSTILRTSTEEVVNNVRQEVKTIVENKEKAEVTSESATLLIETNEIRESICHTREFKSELTSLKETPECNFGERSEDFKVIEAIQSDLHFQSAFKNQAEMLCVSPVESTDDIKSDSYITMSTAKLKNVNEYKDFANKEVSEEKVKELDGKDDSCCDESLLGSLFVPLDSAQKTGSENNPNHPSQQDVVQEKQNHLEESPEATDITSSQTTAYVSKSTKSFAKEICESVTIQSTVSVQGSCSNEEQSTFMMEKDIPKEGYQVDKSSTKERYQGEKTDVDKTVDMVKATKINHWVSSVDISSGEVTAKPLPIMHTSLPTHITNEVSSGETITMSVTASHGKTVVQTSGDVWKGKERNSWVSGVPTEPHVADTSDIKSVSVRRKDSAKKLTHSISEDSTMNTQKATPSKHIKVEIVPFSQRMKDKKYQPLNVCGESRILDAHKEHVSTKDKIEKAKIPVKPEFVINKDERKDHSAVSLKGSLQNKENNLNKHDIKSEESNSDISKDALLHKNQAKTNVKGDSEQQHPADSCNAATTNEESSDKNVDAMSVTSKSANAPNNDTLEAKEICDEPIKYQTYIHTSEQNSSSTDDNAVEGGSRWEVTIQPSSTAKQETLTSLDTTPQCAENLSRKNSLKGEPSKKITESSLASLSSWGERGGISVTVVNRRQSEQDFDKLQMSESSQSRHNEPRRLSLKGTPQVITDGEPELFRVFARRSIKQRSLEKDKTEDLNLEEDTMLECPLQDDSLSVKNELLESDSIISISNNSTIIKISDISITKHTTEKKLEKSSEVCEKPHIQEELPLETKQTVCPRVTRGHFHTAPEVLHSHKDKRETYHKRQRKASAPDIPIALQTNGNSEGDLKQEQTIIGLTPAHSSSFNGKQDIIMRANSNMSNSVTSTLTTVTSTVTTGNGSSSSVSDNSRLKDGVDLKSSKDGAAPSWLQLAQQRRELREQRERLLLGSSAPSFVLESSSKPSRSSKVWDMVNNFQKMQMT